MMDTKVFWLVMLSAMVASVLACSHVCDMQNPISKTYCETNNVNNAVGLRACCLVSVYCPTASCTDWVDVTQLSTYYDVAAVAADVTAQECDCAVVDCVNSGFLAASCVTCP